MGDFDTADSLARNETIDQPVKPELNLVGKEQIEYLH